MEGIKKYLIEHVPTGLEITVEIDWDKNDGDDCKLIGPYEAIKEMAAFWVGSKNHIEKYGHIETFFKKLLQHSIPFMFQDFTAEGLIEKFKGTEGYYPLDGSHGIKILGYFASDITDMDDYVSIETHR